MSNRSSSIYSNAQGSSQQASSARSQGPRKRREVPLPIAIPSAMFRAIRDSCTYLAIDDNPANPLNGHRAAVSRVHHIKGRDVTVCCYSSDLLKFWLAFLLQIPLWSRQVRVQRPSSSRAGHVTTGSTNVANVRCLHLPTPDEIAQATGDDHATADDIARVASVIRRLLVDVGHESERLLLANDAAMEGTVSADRIASASNLVKLDRLTRLGYNKMSLTPGDAAEWSHFYHSELARIRYATNSLNAARISDSTLRNLSSSESETYNNIVVDNLLEALPQGDDGDRDLYGSLDDADLKINPGNAVNPGVIRMQEMANAAKTSRQPGDGGINKRYKGMIEHFGSLCRHKLDIVAEKRNNTLEYRLGEIARAEAMLAINPMFAFTYDVASGFMVPVDLMAAAQKRGNTMGGMSVQQPEVAAPQDVVTTHQPPRNVDTASGFAHAAASGVKQHMQPVSGRTVQSAMSNKPAAPSSIKPPALSFSTHANSTKSASSGTTVKPPTAMPKFMLGTGAGVVKGTTTTTTVTAPSPADRLIFDDGGYNNVDDTATRAPMPSYAPPPTITSDNVLTVVDSNTTTQGDATDTVRTDESDEDIAD